MSTIIYDIRKAGLSQEKKRFLYPIRNRDKNKDFKLEYVRYADERILFLDSNLENAETFKGNLARFLFAE
jgi:hypothetical protein